MHYQVFYVGYIWAKKLQGILGRPWCEQNDPSKVLKSIKQDGSPKGTLGRH